MPISITMPRLSDTMQEGTLVNWRVKVGDKVKSGDLLADVETDKATMELQSFDDGTVAALAVEEGQSTTVGKLILVLAGEGESVEDAAKAAGDGAAATPARGTTASGEAVQAAPPSDEIEVAVSSAAGSRIRVSPLARKIAEDKGVDLSAIKGTGPGGRIIKHDVLAVAEGAKPQAASPAAGTRHVATRQTPAAAPKLESKLIPVSNMRRTIARRLVESKTTIPHFTVTVSVNADPLLSLRQTLNEQLAAQNLKLSINDFIIRAAALAILQHPMVNASWSDIPGSEGIRQHGAVNLGLAVALPEERGGGLVVPVIRDAASKSLRTLSNEARAFAEKARTRGLTVEEMADGTFTLSTLGMFGVEHFEAIINPPQSAILAIGAALPKAVVRNGQVVAGNEMTLTLSADHRVVDGATAAQFLQTVKQMLENPATLLV